MYLINYNTGAVQWTVEKDLNSWVNGLTNGYIMTVIDVEEKKALIKGAENKIGWASIPEVPTYSEEDLKELG